MEMIFFMVKKDLKILVNFKIFRNNIMDETLRIILIIIVSVSIFGLLVFVFVKNYIKKRLEYYLQEKNKNKKL